jgi:hypothetical protein
MKLAIMQPYFLPYIGYFQLINAVDEFVVYDNIEFTKKGWINRNRILVNGKPAYITLPVKNDSDYLAVKERRLADSWHTDRVKMMNRMTESYRKSPNFDTIYPIIAKCIFFEDTNLFEFVLHSLDTVKNYLGIQTSLLISSSIPIDHTLKAESKVIAICKERQANTYLNPIGGTGLYDKDRFRNEGIDLRFLKSNECSYRQYNNDFIPWLSILDVMMFNSRNEISRLLALFSLQ